jgi:predicted dehydrogenase
MKLRTVLIGAGKVGAGFAADPVMARHYPYASHAQVLSDHAEFEWGAVVDRDLGVVDRVRTQWRVPHGGSTIAVACRAYEPEVAVLATPPGERAQIIEELPSLRAVLVEKPLGTTEESSREFLKLCRTRNILVQVNLWRRADERMRDLAARRGALLGDVQAAFALYGNGLHNNGTHIVDLVRMVLGEITHVRSAPETLRDAHGPIPGDVHVAATLVLAGGLTVHIAALDFREYRENGIDLWGTKARLWILQEGLRMALCPRVENRAMQNEREVASDAAEYLPPTCGEAFARMYDNLAAAIRGDAALLSPGESALRSTRVVSLIERSAREGGRQLAVDEEHG